MVWSRPRALLSNSFHAGISCNGAILWVLEVIDGSMFELTRGATHDDVVSVCIDECIFETVRGIAPDGGADSDGSPSRGIDRFIFEVVRGFTHDDGSLSFSIDELIFEAVRGTTNDDDGFVSVCISEFEGVRGIAREECVFESVRDITQGDDGLDSIHSPGLVVSEYSF